jgi:hypothetical protein
MKTAANLAGARWHTILVISKRFGENIEEERASI